LGLKYSVIILKNIVEFSLEDFSTIKGHLITLIGIVHGFLIAILNIVYEEITVWVVNWENHRYNSTYYDSLVLKNFIF